MRLALILIEDDLWEYLDEHFEEHLDEQLDEQGQLGVPHSEIQVELNLQLTILAWTYQILNFA